MPTGIPKVKKKSKYSIYRGVSFIHGKFVANIRCGKLYFLGRFESEIMAAKAYDQATRYFRQPPHLLNFPDENDEVINMDKIVDRKKYSTSRYFGVSYHKQNKAYRVQVFKDGKFIYQRYFKDEKTAAIFYNNFIIENNLNRKLNSFEVAQ